jgi:peptide/nickel transport system substrate-binding protein
LDEQVKSLINVSRRRKAVTLALGTALLLTSSACSGSSDSSSSSSSTLTVAINGTPQSLDPAKNGIGPQQFVQWLAYEPLIRLNADGTTAPGLAKSWKYLDKTNTAFELKLRDGAKFADGTTIDANAVVNALKYFQGTPGPVQGYIDPVEKVSATDGSTVRVDLETPSPIMPQVLSQGFNYGDVISAKGLADTKKLGTQTFGAGPYTLDTDETVAGDHYTYVKNKNYWDPSKQHYAKVVVRVIGDPKTALGAVRTKQINVSTVTTPAQFTEAKSATLDVVTGNRVPIIVWLMDRAGEVTKPMGDVKVREALNYAIDRDSISKALGDAYKPLTQMVAPGNDGYDESLDGKYTFDLDKAKRLLTDAGYADGFTLALASNTDNRGSEVSQILIEQLAKINVKVELKTYNNQPDQLFGDIAKKKFAAVTFAYASNMFSNNALLGQPSVFNPYDAKTPAVTKAFNDLAVAPSGSEADAAKAVNKSLTDNAWFLPVASVDSYIFSQGVDDLGVYGNSGILDVLKWTPKK